MTPFKRITHPFMKSEQFPGEGHFQRGKAARDAADFSQAAQEFEQAIALGLDPAHVSEAYSCLGEAYFQLNETEQAIHAYTRSVELDPQSRKDWNNLGVACWWAGKFDEAVQAHQQALRIDPDDANAYADLGAVYLSMNQLRQAIEVLEKSTRLNPNLPVAHSNLALAYAAEGRFEDSYASMSTAASTGYRDAYPLKFQIDLMKTMHMLHGEGRKRSWLDLLNEAKPEPDHADMTSLRYAYARSDEYDPYYAERGIYLAIRETREAAESGDWHTTIKSARQVLAMNYMHLGTHSHIIKAYLETGEKEKVIPHQHFLRSCLRSVHQSGDGQSYRTAYIAISLDEEYMFLNFIGGPVLGLEYQGQQRFAEHNGHGFDIFEVQQAKTGQEGEIYFNIDLIRKGVADGRAREPQQG